MVLLIYPVLLLSLSLSNFASTKETESTSTNGTLLDDLCEDFTSDCTVDNHSYYKAVYINDSSLWQDINPNNNASLKGAREVNLSTNLDNVGYTQPISVNDFLYYGLPIKNITVFTGGFVSLLDESMISNMIQHVRYVMSISPLNGEFNPGQSNTSNVYIFKNDSIEIIQWDNVFLKDRPDIGAYTFQVQFWSSDDIIFAYKSVPSLDAQKTGGFIVGISDAYHRKSAVSGWVHMYSKLDAKQTKIRSNTAIKFVHNTLCPMLDNCYDCLTADLPGFNCEWCPTAGKCSDADVLHRGHATWVNSGCANPANVLKEGNMCPEYCYFNLNNETSYTPAPPSNGLLGAKSDGSTEVKVICDQGYSVSTKYDVTAGNMFTCSTGGQAVPNCLKSCQYTTAPGNGALRSIGPNTQLKPGANYSVECNEGHRLKSFDPQYVICGDKGLLNPDPSDILCERFCTLPHDPNFAYHPPTHDAGYLHEGETVTIGCKDHYAFADWFDRPQDLKEPATNRTFTCTEATDLSAHTEQCFGYCSFKPMANITYSTLKPKVGESVSLVCLGTLRDIHDTIAHHGYNSHYFKEGMKSIKCERAGPLEMPECVSLSNDAQTTLPNKHSTNGDKPLIAVLILFFCCIGGCGGGWVVYAYRHPTSRSGLFLIEHCRPWRRTTHVYRRHEESMAEIYQLDEDLDL